MGRWMKAILPKSMRPNAQVVIPSEKRGIFLDVKIVESAN